MIAAGNSGTLILSAGLLTVTVTVASVTDLHARIIPNRLTATAALAGLALAAAGGEVLGPVRAAGAGLAAGLPLLLVARLRPHGIGMGDVKLAAVIGLYLGVDAWPALLTGLALAVTYGLLAAALQRRHPATIALPLAPFLAIGVLPALAQATGPLFLRLLQ